MKCADIFSILGCVVYETSKLDADLKVKGADKLPLEKSGKDVLDKPKYSNHFIKVIRVIIIRFKQITRKLE